LIKQLQELVVSLQTQINELKAKLEATQKDVEIVKSEIQFTAFLSKGSQGDEVTQLQEILKQDSEIYPEGLVTGYFGTATQAAVKRFQARHGIEALGIIGPRTRAKLNELITQGAGQSENIPPGLLRAPGIQKKLGDGTEDTLPSPTPSGTIPAIPGQHATSTSMATSTLIGLPPPTPSGTIPAQPATTTASTPPPPGTPPPSSTPPPPSGTSTTTPPSVPPPIFTITSPNGGEQWTAGNIYTITWTSAGTNVSTISIDLYKSGSYHNSIAYNVSNNGSANWTVSSTITAGSDFKIRVYTNMDNNNFDESNSAFSIIVPVTAPSAPPIGYWKFDGNGNNEITGSPSAVTVGSATFKASGGKFGGYFYMPASNDYAKIPYQSMFDLPNSFSIEFWFRQRSNQSFNQNLISKGTPLNNYNFNISRWLWNEYNFGPVIAGHTAANTGYWTQPSNPNQLAHNEWHHVMFTKSPNYHAYYLDGNLIGSKDITSTSNTEYGGPAKTPALDIIIGNPAPDTDIDNLRIYNYAFNRGEVLYNWQNIPTTATNTTTTATTPSPLPDLTVAFTNPPPTSVAAGSDITFPISISNTSTANVGALNVELTFGGVTKTMMQSTLLAGSILGSYFQVTAPSTPGAYTVLLNVDPNNNISEANESNNSVSAVINVILAGPPAPTNVQAVTTSGSQQQPPEMWYYLIFNYTLQSTTQSFNVYRKRPTDASFVKYTYGAQTPVNPSILPLPASNESNLYHRDVNGWQWWTTLTGLAPDATQGEYKFYVTAVDTSGIESAPSETKSFKLYAAPVITSPADGSTIPSPFTITVSGDPSASSPTYGMTLYKKTTGDTAWSVWPAPSTNFTYSGPLLNLSDNPHRLVVWFSSGIYDRSLFGTSIFSVATTTSSINLNTDTQLAQTLTALLKTLHMLTQLLRR
ncbi:MAG: peptidyl-Asp metallopeptidase, partial [Parcubacteria group bacterium Gr01-1014_33]